VQHVFHPTLPALDHADAALLGEELVRLLRLAQAFQEDRQVVLVAELVHVHPPLYLPHCAVEAHRDGQVASVVVVLEDRVLVGAA